MPREKHDSSSEDSDSGSSSNGDGHSDSANSSSEIEDKPRFGPKSTVEKVGTPSKDKDKEKGRSQEEGEKSSPPDNGDKEKSKEKRDDQNSGRLKKRSRSQSPRSRDNKRFKDERSHDRGSNRDRRDDRDRRPRDDRDSERDRGRRHESGRHRVDDKRRDDDRRDDRSRRDGGRDRYDRRSDRDGRDDRRSDRDGGDRRRDRDDRDKEKGEGRREEIKEIKKEDENDSQKRKGEEMNGDKPGTTEAAAAPPQKKVKDAEDIMTRTGGAYIPPAKLRMMQAQITDRSSVAYQRMAWEALKKSINGQINKVNVSNIVDIVRELFQENIVRGRGLLARAMIQAQAASPTFTHVYAALVAIINTKFPQIGELILQRLVYQFKRGFKRNDKNQCLASTRFIAHLVNQQVAHEVVSLEILTLLLENATEDSVEVAISFLKECGQKLSEVSPRGINAIFERLRSILHEGQLDKRVQYMVEVMFATRKDGFKSHPAVISDLDLVEEDDQFTHLLQLDDVTTGFEQLNIFKQDDDYLENEEKYKELKKEILAEGSSDEEGSGDESGSEESSDDDDDDDDEKEEGKQEIVDQTETNMVHLRRTIYLTIQSSLDFEECAHKLLKMELKPGQEVELCYMILDCCAQLRTYEKFFGLLAQRFCQLDKKYVEPFQTIFREQFETIHRLDTNKLRNVAKLFAHLLHTDSISWGVMQCMKLTEEDTTSASRIFIKILFLELSEYLGLPKLNKRLRDPTLQEFFEGILPRQNPKDTRFAVNFFTTIGLGGLTEDLREHLKGLSKQLMQQKQQQEQQLQMKQKEADSSESDSSGSDSSNSDSSDSSSGSSDSSDSESDSSSDSDASKKKKRKKKVQQQKPGSKKSKGKEKQSRGQEDRGGQRKADRPDSRRQDMQQERGNRQTLRPEREVNGRQTSTEGGRPSIKDKLLQLSLPQGMSLVDPHEINRINRINQISPTKRGGRNKKVGKGRRRDRRARRGSNHNSDRDLRGSGSFDFEQGSDREQVYLRSEMDDMDRRRGMSPPPSMRPGRQGDNYDAMERRGGRLDMSPPPALGRNRDRPSEDYPRSGRPDRDLSPHMRGMDRRGASPPAMRQDRRMDYESPPRRLDMDEPRSRGYDRRMDNLPPPRQGDHRSLDSPPSRYQIDRDLDSPRGPRRHDALTPPLQPRGSRRDMESPPPPRRMDSPPRRAALRGDMERERDMLTSRDEMDRGRDIERRRAADVDRSLDRGRGELERAGRGDLDRGVRGDGDRSLDRMRVDDRMLDRGDLERGREPEPRRRDLSRDPDRGRDTGPSPRSVRDLDRGRSGGRAESPRMVHRSPPPPSRREAHHNDLMRDGDRRRGGGDLYESEGKGRIRSVSPVVRKSRSRNEDGGMARQRSLSRERDDRRKGSGRTEQDVSREGGRNKRRR